MRAPNLLPPNVRAINAALQQSGLWEVTVRTTKRAITRRANLFSDALRQALAAAEER